MSRNGKAGNGDSTTTVMVVGMQDLIDAVDALPSERAIVAAILLGSAIARNNPEINSATVQLAVDLADQLMEATSGYNPSKRFNNSPEGGG